MNYLSVFCNNHLFYLYSSIKTGFWGLSVSVTVAYVALLTLAVGAGVLLQVRAATGATDAERMWVAFLLLGCTFVVAGSIVVTQSRGGWFAVVVGLAALACFLCLPRGWRWLGLPAAGVLAAAGMLVFYGGDVALLSRLFGDMTGKAGFRQELWTTGISALREAACSCKLEQHTEQLLVQHVPRIP